MPSGPTIFVQIASYRDPECQWTVRDLFDKAEHPSRVTVGICAQCDPVKDARCFLEPSPRPAQTKIISVLPGESKGVCWARAQAQTLFEDQDYVLMIDSHMRFIPGWDSALIAELARCPSTKPFLSSYPPGYKPPDVLEASPRPVVLRAKNFTESGDIRFEGESLPGDPEKPLRGAFLAAGFIFAPGKFVREIPYDPYMYFDHEEATLAARAYTHGWDVYSATKTFLYHYYYDHLREKEKRPMHWEDRKDWGELQTLSRARFNYLLAGRLPEGNREALADIGRYGLGNARSLKDYEEFCGIDFRNKKVSEKAGRSLFIEGIDRYRHPAASGYSTAFKKGQHMSKKRLDESWKGWLKCNLDRQCNPEELLGILLKAEFSIDSIRECMGDKFPLHSDLLGDLKEGIDYRALSAVRLTRPEAEVGARKIDTDRLQLYTLDDFMSERECDDIVEIITRNLRPSTITIPSTDKYFRTSSTCDLSFLGIPVVQALDEKIARTLGISLPYSEGIQAQRYEVGQEFKAHTDFFEPGTEEHAKFGGERGNRTWTFMVYLNSVPEGGGGGTKFFAIDKTFFPRKGQAVIWNNLYPDGTVNRDTLHAGMPVEKGQKVIITKWFREKGGGPMFSD
jgi:prolyl 4-hydroxylase